jgi:subtilisin family serine protease
MRDTSIENLQVLDSLGLAIQTVFHNQVYGRANYEILSKVAKLPYVEYVSMQAQSAEYALTSEGLSYLSAEVAYAGGLTGSGVKVAVIDGGFDVNSPEIRDNVKEFRNLRSDGRNPSQHGTAVSEVIVDIAPNVELYLYAISTSGDFLQAVDLAVSKGAKIISISLGFIGVIPHDGTSAVSRKLDDARVKGVLPVVAAGNSATRHWRGEFRDPNSNGWHSFEESSERITLSYGTSSFCTALIWDNWPVSNQDYDLYLFDGHTVVANSTTLQTGAQPPGEFFCFAPPAGASQSGKKYELGIKNKTATKNVVFDLFVYSASLSKPVAAYSVETPADARGAVAVGAIHWDPSKRPSSIVEDYSSQGPTMDGRTKPDVIAPSCVSTVAYGASRFCGTSAAAPHVAGTAALLLSGNPSLTADDLQILLEKGAVDLGPSGKDNAFGSGGARTTMVSFDVNPRPGSITVDGTQYGIGSFQKIFVWKPSSTHTAVANPGQASQDTRSGFKEWNSGSSSLLSQIAYDGSMLNLVAVYDTEYLVKVQTDYGAPQGTGWYLKGRQAIININIIEDQKNSTRRVFTQWSGSTQSTSATITVVVDSPKNLVANWKKQYEVVAVGPAGGVSGNWYDVGAQATVSAITNLEHKNATRHIFDIWSGDASGRENTISLTVNSPKRIVAEYKTLYFLNIASPFALTNGSGWYQPGQEVKFLVTNSTWDHGNLTRRVFDSWLGSITTKDMRSAIIVDAPKNITATWLKQYLVRLLSNFGRPSGSGWHNANSAAEISVEPLIEHGNRTRHVFTIWSTDQPVQSLRGARSSITVSKPVIAEAQWKTQYDLQVSDKAFLVNIGELWFDRQTTPNIGFYHVVSGTSERRNLLAYVVDDANRVSIARRSSGMHNISILIDRPRSVTVFSVIQYSLKTPGGSNVVSTVSPTSDEWHDAGSQITVSSDMVWDTISKVRRKSLTGFSIDGTSVNIERGELRFTIPEIAMTKNRELQFISTDQFWIEVRSEFGNARGTGWVDSEKRVEVFVEPIVEHENRTRRVFLGWQGDLTLKANRITPIVDSPKTYTASWKTQLAHALTFKDKQGRIIQPERVTMSFGNKEQIFAQNEQFWVDRGTYLLTGIYWRGSNVAPSPTQEFILDSPQEIIVEARIYDLVLYVKDSIGIPVPLSSIKATLANGTTTFLQAGFDGTVRILQLPLEKYQVGVSSFGQSAEQEVDINNQSTTEIRIALNLPIIGPVLGVIASASILVLRKRGMLF